MPQLRFPSTEAALQDLFEKVGQLSERVWELEKRDYIPRQAFFLLVTLLSAKKVIDAAMLREIALRHADALATSANDADGPEQGREVLFALAQGLPDWFPTGPDDTPPTPRFTVIDGGKK